MTKQSISTGRIIKQKGKGKQKKHKNKHNSFKEYKGQGK